MIGGATGVAPSPLLYLVGKQLDQSEAETAEGVEVAEAEVRARLFRGVVKSGGAPPVSSGEGAAGDQVRDVAPNKRMVLVSFRVEAAAFGSPGRSGASRL